jgi:hypothetical protein
LEEALLVAATLVVGSGGAWSLVLAQASRWSLAAVVVGATVAASVVGWWLVRIRSALHRPSWSVLALSAVIVVGMAAVILPGNRVSFAGTDPGVYVQTARSIAENGDLDLPNPITTYGLEDTAARPHYPALLPSPHRPDRLDFAFYHLYPALAAPAWAVGRSLGLSFVSPAIGMLGALGLTLVLHRLRGLAPAAVGGGFLAFSYLWIFYSDWNGSEIPTASFLLVALLAGLISWDHDRVDAAVAAGALAGLAANGRADGMLVLLAAVGLASGGLLLGRRRLAVGALAGLAPPALLWGVQSYDTTVGYAKGHGVLDWYLLLGAAMFLVGAALVGNRLVGGRDRFRRPLLRARTAAAGLYAVMLVGFWIRSQVSEPGSTEFIDYPTWYPFAAERLTWFLTPVPLALFLLGLAELARARSWRPLAVAAPGLAVFPLYLWQQRITAHMIWAMRRFVPLVWPMMGLLVGLGAALVLVLMARAAARPAAGWLRWAGTGPARSAATVIMVAAAVVPQMWWTVPLRDLRELGGGFDEPERIVDTYGDGLYVWMPGSSHNMLVVPLFLETGGSVVSLDPAADAGDLAEIRDRVAPLPVFVLGDSEEAVNGLGAGTLGYEWVATPRLETTFERVPTEIEELVYLYVVGDGSGAATGPSGLGVGVVNDDPLDG